MGTCPLQMNTGGCRVSRAAPCLSLTGAAVGSGMLELAAEGETWKEYPFHCLRKKVTGPPVRLNAPQLPPIIPSDDLLRTGRKAESWSSLSSSSSSSSSRRGECGGQLLFAWVKVDNQ
ncbi:hypothetical protein CCHR01_08043 [Colletotrichum chrysophilum]|uniref:Uncharacterized protein n=1 Tax=Colletotrichum chrysophilum TaxID=1836956 RepID=A0AAD9EI63_9PEZI|nr:hypothetical protein CCHR01_08043 [Colletotrichum chrysophilum]